MMQSNYLCVILRVKRQKLFILAFYIVEQHADDIKNTKETLCEWCAVSLR